MNQSKWTAPGNSYLSILAEATDLHRSITVKNSDLLSLLQKDGVKFEDIYTHLLAQAKMCHLYNRTVWNRKLNAMDYPTEKSLKNFSWFVAIKNYMSWVKSNFTNYGVPATKLRKVVKTAPPKVIVRREPIRFGNRPISPKVEIPAEGPKEIGGTFSDSPDVSPAPVANPKLNQVHNSAAGKPENKMGFLAPVTAELTIIQKQQIVLQNLSILGDLALAKGAAFEFNELMLALGLTDELVDDESAVKVATA